VQRVSYGLCFLSLIVISQVVAVTRLKGPTYEAGTRLQAASGMHHLIGNLWHVLVSEYLRSLEGVSNLHICQSESLDKKFERPLRQHLEGYKAVVAVC